MSRLLKIKVTPVLSMGQKDAAEAVGGLKVLRDLEEKWGLTPWDENPTNRRYQISSIEAAMAKAEQAVFLGRRERKGNADGDGRRDGGPTSPPTSSPFHPPSC